MPIRRINLYAGPGAGKSTTAASLYAALNRAGAHMGFKVALVTEFIKEEMVYSNQFPEGYDQVWIFGNQIHREDKALRHHDFIVTDSPLPLSVAYTSKHGQPAWQEMGAIAAKFEKDFPSLNIILDREGIQYETGTRYQDLTGAVEMDKIIHKVVSDTTQGDFHVFRTVDFDEILRFVLATITDPLADVPPVIDIQFRDTKSLGYHRGEAA
jgi:hypothetical protein